jgi:2,4-dienoyl-CoA reductase-like NADH-dependent reductase (Old Yellow Enzyme family)
MKDKFSRLFEPIKIGKVEVPNRIALSPMDSASVTPDGYVTDQTLAWYAARSKGGCGLIIVEGTLVNQLGVDSCSFASPHLFNRSHKAGMGELADTIHAFGAKAIIQLNPSLGRQGSSKLSGKTPAAPSAVPCERAKVSVLPKGVDTPERLSRANRVPRPLTVEEIQSMEEQYPASVELAKECGFDGVEIHAAHGYLVHQFLSPRSNRRNDLYGGSLENRMRFLKNLAINTRQRVGRDFCVGVRLSGDEHMPDGIHEDELKIVAQEMESLEMDFLDVSDGCYEAITYYFPKDPSCLLKHSQVFKSVLKIPVITPSVHDPVEAEQALKDKKTDVISLGRQLIADPEWGNKIKAGKMDEIARCKRCNTCLARLNRGLTIRCPLNLNAGRERFMPEYDRPAVAARLL